MSIFLPVAIFVRYVSHGGAAVSVNVELNLWTHSFILCGLYFAALIKLSAGARATPFSCCVYIFIWQDRVLHPSLTTLLFQNFSTIPRRSSSR